MPATWRVHVIQERLRSERIDASVAECDLYGLVDAERHAALDAMIAQEAELPFVIVGGVVASFGDLDLDAVVRVAREVLADDGGCC